METLLQHNRRTTGQPTDGNAPGDNGASVTQQLQSLRHLADTADHILDNVCSANAETFNTTFHQSGGQ